MIGNLSSKIHSIVPIVEWTKDKKISDNIAIIHRIDAGVNFGMLAFCVIISVDISSIVVIKQVCPRMRCKRFTAWLIYFVTFSTWTNPSHDIKNTHIYLSYCGILNQPGPDRA